MKTTLAALFLFLLYSCNSPDSSSQMENKIMDSEAIMAAPATAGGNAQQTVVDSTLKIIKTANISFETENTNATIQKINEILKAFQGYTEQEESNSSDNQLFTSIKCRVPAIKFESFLQQLESVPAKMTGKNIQRQDVTKEYIETETTINAQKELLNRYVQLLSKANKMSDLLEIESKLSELKTSLEISQNQFNTLKKQIRYSEIQINITSSNSQITKTSFWKETTEAFSNGIKIFRNLILGIITLWPLWLLAIIIIVLYKKYQQKRKIKKQI